MLVKRRGFPDLDGRGRGPRPAIEWFAAKPARRMPKSLQLGLMVISACFAAMSD
jgi:hypothetical protein